MIIPYGKQNITQEDLKAVTDVLKSDYLTQGPQIKAFEEAFADYVGSKYAIAVSNGTAALHLSAMALGVIKNTKVIATPITFAASSNCIKYCGGNVEFVDIDPETYLMDISKVKQLLESHPKGTFQGIIPVDFAGRANNLEEFRRLADKYNLWILEDACHAPGGYFVDSLGIEQRCGNGNFADLAIFSFHPVKHIAAGEGGMITTNNQEHYKKLLELRTHGILKDSDRYQNDIKTAVGQQFHNSIVEYPNWYMEMQTLGYNYRLTDFQAALGLSQLNRADEGICKRREIARKYQKAFQNESFIIGQSGVVEGHAYHLYVIEVKNRLGLYNYLRDHKIFAQIHYIPLHRMPYYKDSNGNQSLPYADEYYSRCISLPMFPTLTEEEQQKVIDTIISFY